MKKFTKLSVCLLFLILVNTTNAQTVNFNYPALGLISPGCIFGTPQILNGHAHSSWAGGIGAHTWSGGIELVTKPQETGCALMIGYDFLPGFDYDISIVARGGVTTRLKTSVVVDGTAFPTNSTNTCDGDYHTESYTTTGLGQMDTHPAEEFAARNVPTFRVPGSTIYPYLYIWITASRVDGESYEWIDINQITITGTPAITGSTLALCSGSRVFTVPTISGATYSWSQSSSLTASSASNTPSFTVEYASDDDNAWVEATINVPWSSTPVVQRVYFVAGFPYFSDLGSGPVGNTSVLPHSNYHYYFNAPPGFPATSYTWSVPPGWTILGGSGADNLYVRSGGIGEGGDVSLGITGCSLTRYTGKYVEVEYGGGGWLPDAVSPGSKTVQGKAVPESGEGTVVKGLKITPNPAHDQVQVTLTKRVTTGMQNTAASIHEVRIVDNTGKLTKRIAFNNNQQTQRISVGNIVPGIYVVSVYDGRSWYNGKLIIVK